MYIHNLGIYGYIYPYIQTYIYLKTNVNSEMEVVVQNGDVQYD